MEKLLNYIENEKDRSLTELVEFLRFPSISSVSEHNSDTLQCADWLCEHIKNIGITDAKVINTAGHPIVYAQWLGAGESKPTVLIYGHYDVQPVDPLELWHSDPFEPVIRNGRLYARGTADDKGQLFTHLKAIEAWFKAEQQPPLNIKLIFEGEEEAGVSHIDEFVANNPEMLECDAVLISDTEWFAEGVPSICYSLRGIAFIEVNVTGPDRDLHSGSFGGAVDNPISVLCNIIAELKDKYGRIRIAGFYDDVLQLTKDERNGFALLPFDEKAFIDDIKVAATYGESSYTTLERLWARPTLEINGIIGGYTGEGGKTIIPSKASAKITMRLVPNQSSADITRKAVEHIKSIAPPTVKIEIKAYEGGNPVIVPQDNSAIRSAMAALNIVYGIQPVFMREGGSIPIVGQFASVLNAPVVLLGFGLPGDNVHSPNESMSLDNFLGGIKVSAVFMDEYSKSK